jgi:ABC-type glycerol-3-phosphate transport system substrate-binding protein
LRRIVIALAAALVAGVLVSACGGGSSSSSPGASRAPSSGGAPGQSGPETAWTKEVEGVIRSFEDNVSAQASEQINTSTSQYRLEPMYRAYAANLDKFAAAIEATEAPAACVATRKQLAGLIHKVSDLNGVLSHQSKLSAEEFAALRGEQQYKLHRVGGEFTALSAHLHC